ncbi:hypothetical protein CC78DRAFT_555936 [Lojkania enalia]|uniref:DUF7932 domain-containing protein n=1 Tax=Lojkania enalia TaxID=147567 RepID=A0A9P4K0E8_9PLEO|nr:hypothetical protein CC78DRAFT_555936 [Didymosphaeria enalia]
MRPSEPLYGGRAGRDGISQIRVLRNDLTEGVYPSRYQLVVKDFDVVDENMDGINEPGEYLLVHNIQIQNVGGMPSPKGNVLKILIQPTPWLEPVVSEPLELPREIPPGATVKVPGVLSALIKNESSIRAPGTTFYAQDTVALTAYSPRLQRPLPEFFGGVKVTYQYPLIMSIPKHLDCVAKGDVVRFSWMIRNVSNKAYGGESALCRPACTHMSDPCGVFDLKYADKGLPHEVSDQIDTIDPGSEIPVIEDFQVSQLVPVFTTGFIDISLLLSDPHSGALRPITIFRLSIQISSSYFYNPLAQFLLVINGSTPNAAILQTMDFINNGLHLPVDIFNLSLVGSFRNPETEHNVLWNYVSKSVIIFGNPMNYFQAGFRNVWELFDPWEAYMLAKRNTSFLFVCPADINGLKGWVSQMMVPAFVFQPAPEWSIEKPSEIVKRLGLAQGERSDGILTLPVKKGTFHSLESRIKARSSSITKRLNHRLPTRRFLVGPCEPGSVEETKPSSGEIAIIEGLPHCAKIAVSLQQHADGFTSLTEYNIALIVHTIPFEEQCAIFWNLLGYDHTLGISAKLAYRGDALSHLNAKTVNADFEKDSILNGKATLSWSIVTQLSSELSRFCYDSPWPDSTSKSKIVAQLPLLNNFVSSAPTSLTLASSLGASTLSTVLGPILAAQSPLNFGQWLSQSAIRFGNRKTKVRSVLQRQVKTLTEVICAPEWRTELQNALRTSTSTTKKALARTKGAEPGLSRVQRMHKLNCQALKDLTQTPNAQFFDLDALVGVHRAVDCSVEELREMRRLHEEGVQRIERDMLWSQQMLKDIVNPEGKV